MIIYHPVYDTYYTIIRFLKLLKNLNQKQYEIDRLRIYDYYFLFLNDIKKIVLPKEYSKYKHLLETNKYNRIQNSKYTFSEMESVQELALKALTSYGFIDKELYNNEFIQFSDIIIPDGLISDLTKNETEYIKLIVEYFENISIRELKQRTNLMDYRYELS
ncbi:MAG: hypothetical protein HY951_06995 [Bacteroidia bacterium]|nr:hypothetical protein [Bacteroidia bacterium]